MTTNVKARILQDSITDGASRLTTWELTYPRAIHSELLTHAALRRNSASSRAIPAKKLRERTLRDPFMPVHWGANQKGMQANDELAPDTVANLQADWLDLLDKAADTHAWFEECGLHKQVANRILEPWMMITVILSGTDYANFFAQRRHTAAEPNFQVLANVMWNEYHEKMPTYLAPGEWHLPLIQPDEVVLPLEMKKKISTGRCARVSYLTHTGIRDINEDIRLHDDLTGSFTSGNPGHFSPFEHACMAVGDGRRYGPYEGWKRYRMFFANEAGPSTVDKCTSCGLWGGDHVTACMRALRTETNCPCTECKFYRSNKAKKAT